MMELLSMMLTAYIVFEIEIFCPELPPCQGKYGKYI